MALTLLQEQEKSIQSQSQGKKLTLMSTMTIMLSTANDNISKNGRGENQDYSCFKTFNSNFSKSLTLPGM